MRDRSRPSGGPTSDPRATSNGTRSAKFSTTLEFDLGPVLAMGRSMQSKDHLGIVELWGRDLAIVPELIARAEGREPPTDLRYEKRDGRLIAYSFEGPPREIQVDLLIAAYPADVPGGTPKIVMPSECQLGKDPEKLYRYVEYMATARRDNRCPGRTVVFSPDPEVLEYIERLFALEPHLCPVLVGKDAVPTTLTREQAIARPELAAFCAIVHEDVDVGLELARKALIGARHAEPPRGQANVRILLNCLEEERVNELLKTPEYREAVDEWDTWEPGAWFRKTSGFTRGLREGREEGREEGLQRGVQLARQALKVVLVSRGLEASAEQSAAIDACTSIDVLEHWFAQAARVATVAELLASTPAA
ncbi:hypothetical protein ACNOYE_22270 [Nannocystaceae bacterium ST9]